MATFSVRLPGDHAEISRKLNLAVFNAPAVRVPGGESPPIKLRAGYPGGILIEGRRLWKNTFVSLGQQLATEISILPNMEGIVAKFDCVHVPLEFQRESASESAPLRPFLQAKVWTSEGVTEAIPVEVYRIGKVDLCKDQLTPEQLAAKAKEAK